MKRFAYTLISVIVLFSISVFAIDAFDKKRINSEQGNYHIIVEAITKPLKVGKNILKLTVVNRENMKPAKKLFIEVIPWMPKHEHGVTDIPIVKEISEGEYLIDGLSFSMPGNWEVYLKIKGNGKDDSAVFDVRIAK